MSNETEPTPMLFNSSDVLGAIQRMLYELNGYLGQPVVVINPHVVIAQLQRMAEFAEKLPVPQTTNGDGHEARVN